MTAETTKKLKLPARRPVLGTLAEYAARFECFL